MVGKPSALFGAAIVLGMVAMTACGGAANTSTSSPAASPNAPQRMTLTVGGVERTYYVVTPAGAKGPLPLIIGLHGANETVSTFQDESRLDYPAAAAGFEVAYPEAISGAWNGFDCCTSPEAPRPDDVAFIRQVIEEQVNAGKVDPKRVYVTGFSNGASMVYRLACELSDKIAAFASVSGASTMDTCNPSRRVSMLEIHGAADSLMPLAGGMYGILNYRSAMSTMTRWAEFDGCDATPVVTRSGKLQTTAWTHCQNGTSVTLDAVDGLGHAWFNPEMFGPDTTKMVLAFFNRTSAN